MTVISKTNAHDERKQIGDALTTVEADIATNAADIATNTSAISALDARVTTLEGGVNGTPPTSLKGRKTTNAGLVTGLDGQDNFLAATATASTYNVWVQVLGEASASGVIHLLMIYQTANASDLDAGARLSIDGTVVWSTDNNFWAASTNNNAGAVLVGGESSSDHNAFMAIPFNSSFSLEVRKNENAAGSISFAAPYAYYLT